MNACFFCFEPLFSQFGFKVCKKYNYDLQNCMLISKLIKYVQKLPKNIHTKKLGPKFSQTKI